MDRCKLRLKSNSIRCYVYDHLLNSSRNEFTSFVPQRIFDLIPWRSMGSPKDTSNRETKHHARFSLSLSLFLDAFLLACHARASFRLVALVFFGFAPRGCLVAGRRVGARHFYVPRGAMGFPKPSRVSLASVSTFTGPLRANGDETTGRLLSITL